MSDKSVLDVFGDAGENVSFEFGAKHKVKLENTLRLLEEGNLRRISGTGKAKAKFEKYHSKTEVFQYPVAGDSTIGQKPVKREHSPDEDGQVAAKKIKLEDDANDVTPKKKKSMGEVNEEPLVKQEVDIKEDITIKEESVEPTSEKKMKKKKKHSEGEPSEEPQEPTEPQESVEPKS